MAKEKLYEIDIGGATSTLNASEVKYLKERIKYILELRTAYERLAYVKKEISKEELLVSKTSKIRYDGLLKIEKTLTRVNKLDKAMRDNKGSLLSLLGMVGAAGAQNKPTDFEKKSQAIGAKIKAANDAKYRAMFDAVIPKISSSEQWQQATGGKPFGQNKQPWKTHPATGDPLAPDNLGDSGSAGIGSRTGTKDADVKSESKIGIALQYMIYQKISEGVHQSKIMSMMISQLGKMVGLIMDLILLPFLPLIASFIVMIYQIIMKLFPVRTGPQTTGGEEGAKMATVEIPFTNIKLNIPELSAILGGAIAGAITGAAVGSFAGPVGTLVGAILGALMGAGIAKRLVDWAYDLGNNFMEGLRKLNIYEQIFSLGGIIIGAILGAMQGAVVGALYGGMVGGPVGVIVGAILGAIAGAILGAAAGKIITDAFLGLFAMIGKTIESWDLAGALTRFLAGVMKAITNGMIGVYNGIANSFIGGWLGWKPLPTAETGGRIEQTGVAVVHKGETVVPAGQGGMVVNIYGTYQNDEDLYKKFMDRLRTDQWRLNV
jgi:uncharacterized membrane protein